MKWVVDENVDRQVVEHLRALGHEVKYIAEVDPASEDTDILDAAWRADSILVTGDKDFGELVYRQKKVSAGIVLLRLHGMVPDDKARLVVDVVKNHATELQYAFTVVTKDSIRIRK